VAHGRAVRASRYAMTRVAWSGRRLEQAQVLGRKISMVTVKSGVYRIGVQTTLIPNDASITSRRCPSP
jgi:hypothetical protein